ncbi:MAG TPA: hypothetical protein VN207_08435 [Ktedonobacteraceae bacterium]|nr:hypothetical protein [Ktedonobacteraceae bacterium]
MRLIAASGSQEMKNAFVNEHVQKIADILLAVEKTAKDVFDFVAQFLQKHNDRISTSFTKDLNSLREYSLGYLDVNGQPILHSHLEELCLALKALYDATPTVVNFRRGAIVEVLAHRLVSSRCPDNECFSNHRFINHPSGYASDQVDVAALSEIEKEIEGYACKLKSAGMMSVDCTNLLALSKEASALGYSAHVGAICFDPSDAIRRRLKRLSLPDLPFIEMIAPYGLDNLSDLTQSPF